MTLDVKAAFADIRAKYDGAVNKDKINILLCGIGGSGKTHFATTCRKPVLIDMFDQGGEKTIRREIAKGEIIVDARFSNEDHTRPSAIQLWDDTLEQRVRDRLFDHIGTYMVDSATLWSDAIMNLIMSKSKLDFPDRREYNYQIDATRKAVKLITNLPCDVILTAHVEIVKDEKTGRVLGYTPQVTGRLKTRLPTYFDEVYVLTSKDSPQGVIREMLTASTDDYKFCRTRLGNHGLLLPVEQPNMKSIRKKLGMSTEDLPLYI